MQVRRTVSASCHTQNSSSSSEQRGRLSRSVDGVEGNLWQTWMESESGEDGVGTLGRVAEETSR